MCLHVEVDAGRRCDATGAKAEATLAGVCYGGLGAEGEPTAGDIAEARPSWAVLRLWGSPEGRLWPADLVTGGHGCGGTPSHVAVPVPTYASPPNSKYRYTTWALAGVPC